MHTVLTPFLQALAAASITAVVCFGLNLIPTKGDFIILRTGRRFYVSPNRGDYLLAAIAVFAFTLVIDWVLLGVKWFAFEGAGWIVLLAVSFATTGFFSLIANDENDRLGWGFWVGAFGFLATIITAFGFVSGLVFIG